MKANAKEEQSMWKVECNESPSSGNDIWIFLFKATIDELDDTYSPPPEERHLDEG